MVDTPISAASQNSEIAMDLQVAPTPFYLPQLSVCRSNDWEGWNGFTVPSTFTHVDEEYEALHHYAGLSDISPMARYRITGLDASDYINRLLTSDVSNLSIGENISSAMCNIHGGVIDLVDVLRMADGEFWLICERPHLPWLLDSSIGFEVTIDDMRSNTAALDLIGPGAFDVFAAAGLTSLNQLPENRSQIDKVADAPVRIIRRSNRCQPTFELWMRASDAQSVWSRLFHAGDPDRLHPVGHRVLEALRVEEGRLRAGVDFEPASRFQNPSHLRRPCDLGLEQLVDFDKGYFNGRQCLVSAVARYSLIGLNFGGHHVEPGQALKRTGDARKAGKILSSGWSFRLHSYIALAEVETSSNSFAPSYEAEAITEESHESVRYPRQGKATTLPFLPFLDSK